MTWGRRFATRIRQLDLGRLRRGRRRVARTDRDVERRTGREVVVGGAQHGLTAQFIGHDTAHDQRVPIRGHLDHDTR